MSDHLAQALDRVDAARERFSLTGDPEDVRAIAAAAQGVLDVLPQPHATRDRLRSAADRLRGYRSADAFVERFLGVVAEQIRTASVRAGNIRTDLRSGKQWHESSGCGGEVGDTCECFADALELSTTILGPEGVAR